VAESEPLGSESRPNGSMPPPQVPSAHANHDVQLIAAALDRDVTEEVRGASARLVADCDECARLDADLRLIGAGLEALPRSLPVARDYRLTAEQARSLRSGGWRRILGVFGPAGMPSVRPLATALTTLGLAGLLFTAVLPGAFLGSGASPAGQAPAVLSNGNASGTGGAGAEQGSGPKAGASAPGNVPAPGASAATAVTPPSGVDLAATARPTPVAEPHAATSRPTDAFAVDSGVRTSEPAAPSRPSPLVIVSIILLATGVALFGLRLAALRLE
jgi:hypothetical protein